MCAHPVVCRMAGSGWNRRRSGHRRQSRAKDPFLFPEASQTTVNLGGFHTIALQQRSSFRSVCLAFSSLLSFCPSSLLVGLLFPIGLSFTAMLVALYRWRGLRESRRNSRSRDLFARRFWRHRVWVISRKENAFFSPDLLVKYGTTVTEECPCNGARLA